MDINKLNSALNLLYKFALSHDEIRYMVRGTEQFAIISVEVGYERSYADELTQRTAPVQKEKGREIIPIEKMRHQNLRKNRAEKSELAKRYRLHELDAQWGDEEILPSAERKRKHKKERSFLLKNISFQNAYSLAQKYNQESFLFKPHNGPVQLVNTRPSKGIVIAKKFAYSTAPDLFSTFLHDQSSIFFEFDSDYGALVLPNLGHAYAWNDPELKDFDVTEITPEDAKTRIPEIVEDKLNLTQADEYAMESWLHKKKMDKELTEELLKPEKWKGKFD